MHGSNNYSKSLVINSSPDARDLVKFWSPHSLAETSRECCYYNSRLFLISKSSVKSPVQVNQLPVPPEVRLRKRTWGSSFSRGRQSTFMSDVFYPSMCEQLIPLLWSTNYFLLGRRHMIIKKWYLKKMNNPFLQSRTNETINTNKLVFIL